MGGRSQIGPPSSCRVRSHLARDLEPHFDLDEATRDQVLSRLAEAIAGSQADRLIARTAAESSPVAVTLVGLIDANEAAIDTEDVEVEVWLEIPRQV